MSKINIHTILKTQEKTYEYDVPAIFKEDEKILIYKEQDEKVIKLKEEEKLLEEEIIQLDKKFKKEEREYEEAYAHWEKLCQESNELKEKKKI